MPYLIDGHNVIGQTPGLSLEDPDDEVKLTALVKQFCIREKRKATLIFDGGLPGGVSKLSNADVTVVFASESHTIGDDLLINRIRAEKNPTGLIVVSSDQKIAKAAQQRRMTVMSAAEFGKKLSKVKQAEVASKKEQGISKNDLAEWEQLFSAKKSK